MNLPDSKLLDLLRQMTRKAQECELTARLTGENFNVFDILGLSTKEVRTHSAFLAELLDPRGSHGQGATFLRLFLNQLGIGSDCFSPDKASVKVEHNIGPVDNEQGTGGRVDVVLTDDHRRCILIENKINAGDVYKQLERYSNFPESAGRPLLIYLTLDGKEPSKESTGGKSYPVRLLSYKRDILQWLDDCHKASVSLPVVRESIVQYKHLICELTHQATGDKVNDEAKNLILAHPELADAVALLGAAWQALLGDINSKFEKQMDEKLPKKPLPSLPNGITVLRMWHEDEDGVWIGFRAIKGDEVAELPADDEARKYADVLKRLDPRSRVFPPYWNVGVVWPEPFKGQKSFASLPREKILSLRSEVEMEGFVNGLCEQAEDITERLLAGIAALPMPGKEPPAEPRCDYDPAPP